MDVEKLDELVRERDRIEEKVDKINGEIRQLADSCPHCRNNHYPHCDTYSPARHDWQCVSSGLYDSEYKCTKCNESKMWSVDNLISELPELGCKSS